MIKCVLMSKKNLFCLFFRDGIATHFALYCSCNEFLISLVSGIGSIF